MFTSITMASNIQSYIRYSCGIMIEKGKITKIISGDKNEGRSYKIIVSILNEVAVV